MTSAAEAGGGLALTWHAVARARGPLGPNKGLALRAWRRGLSYSLPFPVDNDSQESEA